MTIFKGFLTITKRNLNIVFMYVAIFLAMSIMVDKMLGSNGAVSFEQESLDIAVIDRDGGELAKGLADYLACYHHIKDIPDDESILQDRLFYREVYYVVTIPENFEEKCLENGEKLPVTKVPGSTSGYYIDQQINTFLNDMQILTKGGFSLSGAISEIQKLAGDTPDVNLIDKTGHGGEKPRYAFMYQYTPYIMISILCYVLTYIMIAFEKPDVKRRMLCSSVSGKSLNLQLFAGFAVIGLVVWGICTLLPALLYGKEMLSDRHLPLYLANSFLLMLVSLSLSFLVSSLVKKDEIISAVVNVLSLGMSFSCGVFVDLDVLSKGMRAVAHFLPVYWYETANNLIAGNSTFSAAQRTSLYRGFGIQLLFAAAFLGVALIFRQNRARVRG